MECKDVYLFICDNLDHPVDSPECRAIRKHLEECENCAAYLDSLKKTIALYSGPAAPTMPVSVHRRLMSTLHAKLDKPGQSSRHPRH